MSPLDPATPDPGNALVAHTLHWLAVLLEIDDGPRERVEAWRQAAYTVRQLEQPVAEVAREGGAEGLERLGFAPYVAVIVAEWIRTGKLPLLEARRRAGGLWPALAEALCGVLGIAARRRKPVATPELELPGRRPYRSLHRAVWESWH